MATINVTLDANRTLTLRYVRKQYTLSVVVLANDVSVSIPSGSTIDGKALASSMTLDPGTYTVTVPDQIVVGGVTYNFSTSSVT